MSQQPRWSSSSGIKFFFSYGLAKLRVPFEVRSPRMRFTLFEARYSLANLINSVRPGTFQPAVYSGPETIETKFGRFRVRPGTQDAAIISPAFEREDLDYTIETIEKELMAGNKVLFLDVGANIGHYVVAVGTWARRLRPANGLESELRLMAFEPLPENLALLRTNLALNGLGDDFVEVVPLALGDRSGEVKVAFVPNQPGDTRVVGAGENSTHLLRVERGDSVLENTAAFDTLVIKIDVEGQEQQVLMGLEQTLKRARSCWLCVEDIFDREALYAFLEMNGFEFHAKIMPYNSWWKLEATNLP